MLRNISFVVAVFLFMLAPLHVSGFFVPETPPSMVSIAQAGLTEEAHKNSIEALTSAVPESTPELTPTATAVPEVAYVLPRALVAAPAVTPEPRVAAHHYYDEKYISPQVITEAAAAEGMFPIQTTRVATCESGIDLDFDGVKESIDRLAVGGQGERGPMQIHPMHIALINRMGYTWDQMFEVGPNMRVAHVLYDALGWGGWSCGYSAY